MMVRVKLALLTLVAVAYLAAGCGEDSGEAAPEMAVAAPADTTSGSVRAAASRARRGPLVKLRNSEYGRVLFNGSDRALYLFTRDAPRRTRCYGACAKAWPPFYAKGRPRAAPGVRQRLLGTIRRKNGRRQVTYRGRPLYFYVSDPPRQILCQNVVEFGGTWLVVDAAGRAVR